MKKLFSVAMAVLLAALNVSCLAETGSELLCPPHTDTEVDAVFAAPDIQPFTEADGDQEMLDSIWVYYTDGSFEQFAELDGRVTPFSTGTYQFIGDADFIYEHAGAGNGQIVIRRDRKLSSGGLADYQSEHTYELGTLGFTQLYAPNQDRRIVAVFFGNDRQPFTEKDGDQEMLDTWWIYFSDGTFEQYAILDGEPKDTIVLFSKGTYQLSEGSSFLYEKNGSTGDVITIRRTEKFSPDGLAPYDSVHDYVLDTLGFDRIVAIGR